MKSTSARLAKGLLALLALFLIVFVGNMAFGQHGDAAAKAAGAAAAHHGGGEANLIVPNLYDPNIVNFLGGMAGAQLLKVGLLVSALGMAFGFFFFNQLKNMAVHKSMRSEEHTSELRH